MHMLLKTTNQKELKKLRWTHRLLKVIKIMELNCRSSVLQELCVVANNG